MPIVPGEQAVATILKHDPLNHQLQDGPAAGINDAVLLHHDLTRQGQAGTVPLNRLAELWVAHY